MSGQKPVALRMQEMLLHLQRYNAARVDVLDRKVLNRLIKAGKVKITNGSRATIVNGLKRVMTTTPQAVPTELAPIKIEEESPGPYAKRKADLEEMGVSYRGKTWGKVRVDLPREEREKRINDKKLMWKKLKRNW